MQFYAQAPVDFWNDPLGWFTDPFRYQIIQRAFICAPIIGAMCGLIGVYVVLRRMSYIGHGLSHSIFGGAVVSYMLKINFYIGAGAWGFLSALLIIWTGRRRKIGADAAIGIITTASFAIGIIIISAQRNFRTNFDAALFGNVLAITDQDLWVVLGTSLVITGLVILFYKQLLFTTFDPEVAAVYGVKTGQIDTLFSLLLAALLIASMQIVGVTLIAASLVTPPTVARLLTNDFHKLIWISTGVGAVGGLAGMYASWHLNWATGGTIVVTHAVFFGLALLYSGLIRPLLVRKKSGTALDQPVTSKITSSEQHNHQHEEIFH